MDSLAWLKGQQVAGKTFKKMAIIFYKFITPVTIPMICNGLMPFS
ncbi:hypothetical protein VVMO6_02927 [Vibrio vulnificus MO6-24/O]|nr:hypothetical protein VVMO6_02927 [Vibrio vulnificus MO6-24/O]